MVNLLDANQCMEDETSVLEDISDFIVEVDAPSSANAGEVIPINILSNQEIAIYEWSDESAVMFAM